MRFGIVLRAPWAPDALLAEDLGFDLGVVDEAEARAPFVVVAALGAVTCGMRLAASIDAGPHPVTLAEDAAVADLACSGRLVMIVGGGDAALLRETIELLFHAWAARPLRHDGPRWRVPAHHADNRDVEARVRVTPVPAQMEPTVWLRGAGASVAARAAGIAIVAGPGDGPEHWTLAVRELGLAAARLRRPGRYPVDVSGDGDLDVAALVRALRREQADWGLDLAIVELPPRLSSDARRRAMRTIATAVRPRVQIDHLPPGLEQHWDGAR